MDATGREHRMCATRMEGRFDGTRMAPHGRGVFDDVHGPVGGTVRGALWRVAVSVVVPVVWIGLTLVYLALWAHGFTLPQEIVVGVVSALSLLAALAVLWISFGMQLYHHWVD